MNPKIAKLLSDNASFTGVYPQTIDETEAYEQPMDSAEDKKKDPVLKKGVIMMANIANIDESPIYYDTNTYTDDDLELARLAASIKQARDIHTIRNWVIFFGIWAIIAAVIVGIAWITG